MKKNRINITMIDKNQHNHLDESEEKALYAMQRPSKDMPPERMGDLENDEESMEMCAEIARMAIGMQIEKNPLQIDAADELAKFKRRHRKPHIIWKGIGVCAVAAILAGLIFLIGKQPGQKSEEAMIIYKADANRQHVMLQSSDMPNPEPLSEIIARQPDAGVQYTNNSICYAASDASGKSHEEESPITYVLTIPKGETFQLTLSDGSEVYLNADSRLTYPKTFQGNERVVSLEGEAYFKVTHDGGRKPFIVKSGTLQVQVLGTEFNVQSYEPKRPTVTLVEGKVALNNAEGKHLVNMSPGQSATLEPEGGVRIENVDIESFLYWKQGYFYFDDVSLADMMREIGEWYNIDVVFENSEITDLRMHFFADRNKGIQNTVDRLNKMERFHAYVDNGRLIIR